MKRRVFGGMCVTAIVAVLLSALLFSLVCYQRLYDQMKTGTRNEAGYVVAAIEGAGIDYLDRLAPVTGARITYIAADGTVLYDSAEPVEQMGNHAGREEVRAALLVGQGEGARLSDTLGTQTYYYAIRLSDGTVLRVSNSTGSLLAILLRSVPLMVFIVLLAMLAAVLLAGRQSRRILKPINDLNLEEPSANAGVYDELSPFFSRIASQNRQIREQMEALKRQREELAAITANMREALVVVDGAAEVLSMNRSARALLEVGDEDCNGKSVFAYCRSRPFLASVERALEGESGSAVLELKGRTFRLTSSPAESTGDARGAILLFLDITEAHSAEQMRREFSANVSHELKTPLTSISGYAELLKNGMVQPQDVGPFAQRIYDEANRLVALVQDIIKLSRLDEGTQPLQREPVALLELARSVTERLKGAAAERQVSVTAEGTGETVTGVPALLDEMLYNLCDNAVRYNRPGGSVTVTVLRRNDGRVQVAVADTGIGIPEADRERVFERFYRVDAGRSKQSGGTGLGLSIVKHAAQCHSAELQLRSREGEGTTVSVVFPPE